MNKARIILVKVKPNARTSMLKPPDSGDDIWQAQLLSPPVDGKANDELVKLTEKHFGCPRKAVTLAAGHKGRLKRLRIEKSLNNLEQ